MRRTETRSEVALDRARAAYETAAEQTRQEQEALAGVHRTLLAIAEDNVRLHQRSLVVIEALARDLERIKRQIRRMNTARS